MEPQRQRVETEDPDEERAGVHRQRFVGVTVGRFDRRASAPRDGGEEIAGVRLVVGQAGRNLVQAIEAQKSGEEKNRHE